MREIAIKGIFNWDDDKTTYLHIQDCMLFPQLGHPFMTDFD